VNGNYFRECRDISFKRKVVLLVPPPNNVFIKVGNFRESLAINNLRKEGFYPSGYFVTPTNLDVTHCNSFQTEQKSAMNLWHEGNICNKNVN